MQSAAGTEERASVTDNCACREAMTEETGELAHDASHVLTPAMAEPVMCNEEAAE